MKYTVLSLLLLVTLQFQAQTWVQVPDANFQAFLTAHYPAAAFMTSGSDFFVDADHADIQAEDTLNVSANNIADLEGLEAFQNLSILKCYDNVLTTLPILPMSLTELYCNDNLIDTLPALPGSLLFLYCYNNQLHSLPALPNSLHYLECGNNQLTSLPTLPPFLSSINCSDNQLTSLPDLPQYLNWLACPSNQLTVLPNIPQYLQVLICSVNELDSLPELPASLHTLDCQINQLSVLPDLPLSLTSIICDSNNLSALPAIPSSMTEMYCRRNQLTELPTLPASLVKLGCSQNEIVCFAEFSVALSYLDIEFNPFSCLPNYIPAMSANLLAFPLCSENDPINNPNGCQSAFGVQGLVFNDVNNDCVTTGEILTYVPMSVHDSNNNLIVSSTSLVNGNYYFAAAPGDYELEVETANLNPSLNVTCPVNNLSGATVTSANPVVGAGDFGLKCVGFDLGVQSVVSYGASFPGETHSLEVLAGDLTAQYNAYCATGISGTVMIDISGPGTVTFGGSPTTVSGNTATYSIADFGAIGANLFTSTVLTNTTATAGEQFCVTVTVSTGSTGDLNAADDTYNYCYAVVNSFDPNVKETYPEVIAPNSTEELTYTIHFQNTGNAAAMNIRLADVLDTKLDLSTLKIVNTSADYTYTLNPTSRLLSIRFPNIMLADSASDPQGSIGFVQYRIKPVAGLTNGQIIDNTASIYFDYNAPIVTNTSHNLVSDDLGIAENVADEIRLYPNPAKNVVTFESENEMEEIEFFGLNGAKVKTIQPNLKKASLDISSLENGVYIVKIHSKSGVVNKRLVISQ